MGKGLPVFRAFIAQVVNRPAESVHGVNGVPLGFRKKPGSHREILVVGLGHPLAVLIGRIDGP